MLCRLGFQCLLTDPYQKVVSGHTFKSLVSFYNYKSIIYNYNYKIIVSFFMNFKKIQNSSVGSQET